MGVTQSLPQGEGGARGSPHAHVVRQHRALVGNASEIGRERVRVSFIGRHSHGDQPSKSGCGACRRGGVVVPCPHQLAPRINESLEQSTP